MNHRQWPRLVTLAICVFWTLGASARDECEIGQGLRKLVNEAKPLSTEAYLIQHLEKSGFIRVKGTRFAAAENEDQLVSSIVSGRIEKIGSVDATEPGMRSALSLTLDRLQNREPLDLAFFERLDRSLLSAKVEKRTNPNLSDVELVEDFERAKRRSGLSLEYISLKDQKTIDTDHLKEPEFHLPLHDVDRLNELTLARLNTIVPRARGQRIQAASPSKVDSVFDKVVTNPVAKTCRATEFDPTGFNKFCYGRAVAGHIEALRQGISKDAIRKLFIVGRPSVERREWNYHVATAIYGADGRWWVLDPTLAKPILAEDWYRLLTKEQGTGLSRLYVTDPRRIGPRIVLPHGRREGEQTLETMRYHDKEMNDYFKELMKHFKAESRQVLEEARREKFLSTN